MDERAADICGLSVLEGLDTTESYLKAFKATSEPLLRLSTGNWQSSSGQPLRVCGGSRGKEQLTEIITWSCKGNVISDVHLQYFFGQSEDCVWSKMTSQQSFHLIYIDIFGNSQWAALIIDCTDYALQWSIKRTAFLC